MVTTKFLIDSEFKWLLLVFCAVLGCRICAFLGKLEKIIQKCMTCGSSYREIADRTNIRSHFLNARQQCKRTKYQRNLFDHCALGLGENRLAESVNRQPSAHQKQANP